MMGTGSLIRIAISAAGGVAVTALAFAAAPAGYAEDDAWGAIAVSPDGKSIGVATNQPNQYLADLTATTECRRDNPVCNVLITFKHPDCGAIVENGEHYFGDSGATQQEAEQNAMNQSPGGKLLRAVCNNPDDAAGTSTETAPSADTAPSGG